jgi:hypothetical protein
MNNTQQVTYTGQMYMGSNKTPVNVVFDTGSGWLTVTTKNCFTCTTPFYDPASSTSAKFVSNEIKTLSVRKLVIEQPIFSMDQRLSMVRSSKTKLVLELVLNIVFLPLTFLELLNKLDWMV